MSSYSNIEDKTSGESSWTLRKVIWQWIDRARIDIKKGKWLRSVSKDALDMILLKIQKNCFLYFLYLFSILWRGSVQDWFVYFFILLSSLSFSSFYFFCVFFLSPSSFLFRLLSTSLQKKIVFLFFLFLFFSSDNRSVLERTIHCKFWLLICEDMNVSRSFRKFRWEESSGRERKRDCLELFFLSSSLATIFLVQL